MTTRERPKLSVGAGRMRHMPTTHTTPLLSELDRGILDLERGHYKYLAAKHDQAMTLFGLTPVRYYVELNRIIDTPAAEAYDVLLVRRLRRLRDTRRHTRSTHRGAHARP